MSQGGRIYTDRISINPPIGAGGSGTVNFYATDGDPNGVIDADAGDRAWQIGSTNKWVCSGGTVWAADTGGGGSAQFVVWRPAGVLGDSYLTFPEAQAAALALVLATGTPCPIYCVGETAALTVTEAGTYDMGGIPLLGYREDANGRRVAIETYADVVFTNFVSGVQNIDFYHLGVSPLCTYVTTGTSVATFGPEVLLTPGSGGGSMLAVSGVGALVIKLLDDTAMNPGDGGNVVVIMDTATVEIKMYSHTSIVDDCIVGELGTFLNLAPYSSSRVSPTQTGFTGTRTDADPGLAYVALTPADWSDNPPLTVGDALDRLASHIGPVP